MKMRLERIADEEGGGMSITFSGNVHDIRTLRSAVGREVEVIIRPADVEHESQMLADEGPKVR